jgi:hypothetical protein
VARAVEASAVKRFHEINTVRHVLVFERVCRYHGVYSFVFVFIPMGTTHILPI